MERADAQFSRGLDYLLAAARLDNAAAEYDELTAGRLRRLATTFRERAREGLTVMGMRAA